jgi:methylmalonyl-CoA/ethylmalonyl-CoA epimerase
MRIHFNYFRHLLDNFLKALKVSRFLGKDNFFNPSKMKKIEHIGIAVRDLTASNKLFASLLGVDHYKIEVVESEGVRTSFFKVGDIKIELLEASTTESPIAKFIEKRGEGIHHIAFEVDDVGESSAHLKKKGFQVINESPKQGADEKTIAFLHPKTTNGVLVEICSDFRKI